MKRMLKLCVFMLFAILLAACGQDRNSGSNSTVTAPVTNPTGTNPAVNNEGALLTHITVTPENPSIFKGATQKFTAIGSYSDGTMQDITSSVAWSSLGETVATIGNSDVNCGLAIGYIAGATIIEAKAGDQIGFTYLYVTSPVISLTSIVVTPVNPIVAVGLTQQFAATGIYSDNTTQDITNSSLWSSSDTTKVTIGGIWNQTWTPGKATAVSAGMATITATYGAVSASTVMTIVTATIGTVATGSTTTSPVVPGANLVSILVTPANASVPTNGTEQFVATGIYSNNVTQDLTSFVAWTSSDITKAIVSSALPSYGLATGISPGTAVITATVGTISGSAMLNMLASSSKTITAFSFPALSINGYINESSKMITVNVPYGADVTSLVASFITTGANVSIGSSVQISGITPNDFTRTLYYTVTASDNSEVSYFVTVIPDQVNIPKSGQLASYAAGDDGSSQKGFAWPAQRFTYLGYGPGVTDNLTGLMWLIDANCINSHYPVLNGVSSVNGQVTLQQALNFVAGINSGAYPNCGAGYTDWRLPNVNELESLVNFEQTDSAQWLNTLGFSNIYGSTNFYWSSTTIGGSGPIIASKVVSLADGSLVSANTASTFFVWPVRGGQDGVVYLPKTGQNYTFGAGDDGNLQKGISWPVPRFTNPDGSTPVINGTVVDQLTGRMWLKDANCINTAYVTFDDDNTAGDGQVTWQHALDFVAGINSGAYPNCGAGYTDWRLPNVNELKSLINWGQADPGYWLVTHGFSNVNGLVGFFGSMYWSSTTSAGNLNPIAVSISQGNIISNPTGSTFFVWPVRGGQ